MKKNRSKLTTADKVIDTALVCSLGGLFGFIVFTGIGGFYATTAIITSTAAAIGLAAGTASIIATTAVGLLAAASIGIGAFLAYKYAKDAVNKRINAKLESLEQNKQDIKTKEKRKEKGNEINNTKEKNKKNTSMQVSDPQNLDYSIAENKSKQM